MTGWIEWTGDEKGPPEIEGLRCDVKFRDGEIMEDCNSYDWWPEWVWKPTSNKSSDIVAYRRVGT